MKHDHKLRICIAAIYGVLSFSVQFDNVDFEYAKVRSLNVTTGATNSYAQAYNYGKTHPTRDGGSWNGWYKT